ncbi:MAG TPA: MerR family transcriptional regulator [Terriglobia bacterium]|jgi:DNA-binding transcriptional MerR regulator
MKNSKADKNLYPIRAAAKLTRLSIDTLRAWEKRYAAVQPLRKEGIRFYSEADVERLSLLRQALDSGHSIGQAARLSNKELAGLNSRATESRTAFQSEKPLETILNAISGFDYGGADRELVRLASLMPPRDLIYTVALPLMRIVGEQWHEQRLRIAQEHLVSQLLRNLLSGMLRIYSASNPPAVLMTCTLSGDLHEFGILAAAILSAGAGMGVIHLGPNLPANEIAYAAKRSGANIVLLSITTFEDRSIRDQQLRSVRVNLPSNVEVWVGVNPPNLSLGVRGVHILKDFADLEREIQRLGGKL